MKRRAKQGVLFTIACLIGASRVLSAPTPDELVGAEACVTCHEEAAHSLVHHGGQHPSCIILPVKALSFSGRDSVITAMPSFTS